jgi:hypothetical protein
MGQRLDCLGVVDVGPHGDGAGHEVGDAVGPAQDRSIGGAAHVEPAAADQLLQGVPQPGGCFADQQLRLRWGGQRVAVGLGQVEHGDRGEPDDRPGPGPGAGAGARGRVGVGGVLGAWQLVDVGGAVGVGPGAASGDGGQDVEGLLAFADLAAHRRPRLIPGHGSRGVLCRE